MKNTPHSEQQIRASHVSIIGAALTLLTSLIIGLATDSVTLLLDAATGLVILLVALLVRIIIKKVESPPDHAFTFGYGKYEPFTVVLQNVAIITVCLLGINFAVQDIIHPDDMHGYFIPAAATLLSGAAALWLGSYLKSVSKRTGSSMLKTSAMHWFIDAVLSFSMCAGFSFGFVMRERGYSHISIYVDPVMAIVLSLILVKMPIQNLLSNILELLDAAPAKEVQDKIKKIVDDYKPKSFGVHRMRFRKAGKRIFLDICFLVHGNLSVKEADELAVSFERDLLNELPHCDTVVCFKTAPR